MAEQWCPVFKPSKEEFARPFTDYVREVFSAHPDLPAFKVVPPPGWKPRKGAMPDFQRVNIKTPIRQHAFGKGGAYRCLLVEHKTLTLSEFQAIALEEEHALRSKAHGAERGAGTSAAAKSEVRTTRSGRAIEPLASPPAPANAPVPASEGANSSQDKQKDEVDERAFWATVTLNPPLYGADTPVSFFDEKLSYGWNLRCLGDLLTTAGVPSIPGVTTPYTYFGMWRSFFGWHKEDADLLSINYLHHGAPKVWYCVSPKHSTKFERMAAQLFPDAAATCPEFIRHKDLLISPAQLRTYGIPYMQAKHNAGEFIVLNAAAYHAGFNAGFNVAEAVNFATADWLPTGHAAQHCTCPAMKDCVKLSMRYFDATLSSEDEEDGEGTDTEQAPRSEGRQPGKPGDLAQLRRVAGPANVPASTVIDPDNAYSRALRAAAEAARRKRDARPAGALDDDDDQVHQQAREEHEPEEDLDTDDATDTTVGGPGAVAGLAAGGVGSTPEPARVPAPGAQQDGTEPPVAPQGAGGTSAPGAKRSAEEEGGRTLRSGKRLASGAPGSKPIPALAPARARRSAAPPGPVPAPAPAALVAAPDAPPGTLEVLRDMQAMPGVKDAEPSAIVWEDRRGRRYFHLVLPLVKAASSKHDVLLRVLREGPDGLFVPTCTVLEEHRSTLVQVRCQLVRQTPGHLPAWKLLTLRSRLLDEEDGSKH